MTPNGARELLPKQAQVASGCTRHGTHPILAEVRQAVDGLIRGLGLVHIFGFAPGTRFEGA